MKDYLYVNSFFNLLALMILSLALACVILITMHLGVLFLMGVYFNWYPLAF